MKRCLDCTNYYRSTDGEHNCSNPMNYIYHEGEGPGDGIDYFKPDHDAVYTHGCGFFRPGSQLSYYEKMYPKEFEGDGIFKFTYRYTFIKESDGTCYLSAGYGDDVDNPTWASQLHIYIDPDYFDTQLRN